MKHDYIYRHQISIINNCYKNYNNESMSDYQLMSIAQLKGIRADTPLNRSALIIEMME